MRVIPPVAITGPMLASSSVAEPSAGETVYSSATSYALDARVIRTETHRTYRSKQANNYNRTPETNPDWWEDVGPTNRWAMFDLANSKQTVSANGTLTVEVALTEWVDSIALLGLEADSATIDVIYSGSTVHTRTVDLEDREVHDLYSYFYSEFRTRPSLVLFDLPPYANSTIRLTLTRAGGSARCGSMVLGTQVYIGKTQYGAVSDAVNFSNVARDATTGVAALSATRNIPRTTQRLLIEKAAVNRMRQLRDDLNGKTAVWSALDDHLDGYFEALLVLGIARRFQVRLDKPTQASIELEIEGV